MKRKKIAEKLKRLTEVDPMWPMHLTPTGDFCKCGHPRWNHADLGSKRFTGQCCAFIESEVSLTGCIVGSMGCGCQKFRFGSKARAEVFVHVE